VSLNLPNALFPSLLIFVQLFRIYARVSAAFWISLDILIASFFF
jgi:hypothetical protein